MNPLQKKAASTSLNYSNCTHQDIRRDKETEIKLNERTYKTTLGNLKEMPEEMEKELNAQVKNYFALHDKLDSLHENGHRLIQLKNQEEAKLQQLKQQESQLLEEVRSEAKAITQDLYRDKLIIALAKMIHTPGTPSDLSSAAKCKELVKPYILQQMQQKNISDLLKFSDTNQCMHLTSSVACVINSILQDLNCSSLDLTKFQNQIDPQALRTVLIDKKITRIVLDPLARGTQIEKTALEIRKIHSIEVIFPEAAKASTPATNATPVAQAPESSAPPGSSSTKRAVDAVKDTTKTPVTPTAVPRKALPAVPPTQKQKTQA